MTLSAKRFTASPTGAVAVKFRLSSRNLRALKRSTRLRFRAAATLGSATFTTTLVLVAP